VVDCLFGFGFSSTAAVRPGLSGSEGRAGTPAVPGGREVPAGAGWVLVATGTVPLLGGPVTGTVNATFKGLRFGRVWACFARFGGTDGQTCA